MKKKIIIVVIIVLFTIIGIIEFFGVPKKTCLKEGNYERCYTDYYIYPYLYNYYDCNCRSILSMLSPFLACMATPCGIDVNLDKENAYAGLLGQLCADKTNNKQKIIDWYKENNAPSSNIEFICNEGTKIYLRM